MYYTQKYTLRETHRTSKCAKQLWINTGLREIANADELAIASLSLQIVGITSVFPFCSVDSADTSV